MVVEWACLARVDERGKEWSQQARHAVAHSDAQIFHRKPPLSSLPSPETVQYCYAIQGRLELLDSAGFGVGMGLSLPTLVDYDDSWRQSR